MIKEHVLKCEGYSVVAGKPVATLQMFIIGACNIRCSECFMRNHFGSGKISLDTYKQKVTEDLGKINKVIIMGGEPTIHADLPEMIKFNNEKGLRTTIYTNGHRLEILNDVDLSNTSIRISASGVNSGPKPLTKLIDKKIDLPGADLQVVTMVSRVNMHEYQEMAYRIEHDLGFGSMYISSIRDLIVTDDYWKNTENTLPIDEYALFIQDFVDNYKGNLNLHIARRGVLTLKDGVEDQKTCRYKNILSNGHVVSCPYYIYQDKHEPNHDYNCRKCIISPRGCILQKLILKRNN